MSVDIVATIKLEGTSQFSEALEKIKAELKTLTSEIKTAASNMNETQAELSAIKSNLNGIGSKLNDAAGNMKVVSSGIGEAAAMMGTVGNTIDDAAGAIKAVSAELKNATSEMEKAGKSGQDSSKGIWDGVKKAASGVGSFIKNVGTLASKLNDLAVSTEAYRSAQAMVNTAFEATGQDSAMAKQAYDSFYGLLGDTSSAAAASQQLATLANSAKDVSTWTDIAAGVSGTFGDALPIQDLVQSANATAQTGKVAGNLADALKLASISEEDFNTKLAECATEGQRSQLIMDTLSSAYDDAATAFYRNNEELIKARENQNKLDEAMANIGASVTTVKNAFLEQFAPVLVEASEKVAEFIAGLDVEEVVNKVMEMISTFKNLLPVIVGAATAIGIFKVAMSLGSLISTVTETIKGLTTAQTALNTAMKMNAFVLIASLIAGLVTSLITLWNTNEGFREAVLSTWEQIKAFFVAAWEQIKLVWDAVSPYFSALWESIKTVFSVVGEVLGALFSQAWEAIKLVWDAVSGYFQNVWNTIQGIFSAVKSVLSGDFQGAWEAIKGILSGWGDYFSGLWQKVKDIFSGVGDWFKTVGSNLLTGIWNGINNKVEWLKEKVRGVVDKIKGWFTGSDGFDTHSPSVWAQNLAGDIMDGLPLGFNRQLGAVLRSAQGAIGDIQSAMYNPVITADVAMGNAAAQLLNGLPTALGQEGGYSFDIRVMLDDNTTLARKIFSLNKAGAKQAGFSFSG